MKIAGLKSNSAPSRVCLNTARFAYSDVQFEVIHD